MSEGNGRIRTVFGSGSFDNDAVKLAKDALAKRLVTDRERFRTIDDLHAFIASRGNELLITMPRPMRVDDPDKEIDALFSELVGETKRKATVAMNIHELDDTFQSLCSKGKAEISRRVPIPFLTNRDFVASYAFRNGVQNFVRSFAFGEDAREAESRASRFAFEGSLIMRHPESVGGKAKVIIVSASLSTIKTRVVESALSPMFEDFEISFITNEHVPSYAREVEQQAH